MSSVQLNPGSGGPFVATDDITRDTQTEKIEIITLGYTPDGTTLNKATVDANGLHVNVNGALPAGGNNIGHVTVDTLPAIPAGANNIGSVNVANTPSVSISGTPNVSVSNTPNVNVTNDVKVSEDGCVYLNINDTLTHTVTASLLVGFQELSGSTQTANIKAYDGPNTSSPLMTPPIVLGAGQIITMPRGGIQATSGQITFQISAAPGAPGIQALYHA